MKLIRDLTVIGAVYFLLQACCIPLGELQAQEEQPRNLFRPLSPAKGGQLRIDQEKRLDQLRKQPTTADLQVAELDLNLFQSKSVTLNVGDDKLFGAVTDRIEKRSTGDYTWFGKIPKIGVGGGATLVVKDGNVTGTIRADGELYEVVPLGAGRHAIIHLDQSKFPLPEGPDPGKLKMFQEPRIEPSREKDSLLLPHVDDGLEGATTYTIRVILGCTPSAVSTAGGKEALEGKLRAAVEDANQSYVNSRIPAKLEIASIYETGYQETGNIQQDLDRFAAKKDGHIDEVHSLRVRHKADIGVMVVAKSPGMCGLAKSIGCEADTAFCLVNVSCLTNLVLAHEIGHLMGARHNWEVHPEMLDKTPQNHGFWYVGATSKASWGTVMSYGCPQGGCPRIPYWSNPDISVNGISTGSNDCCNNAAIITRSLKKISNFRNLITE